MKLKLLVVSTMLLSGLAIGADTTSISAAPASAQQTMFTKASIAFKADVSNDEALSASTGAGFKNALTTYENDGNENTTTRAGLRVRKSSVIVALQHNMGINVASQLTAPEKFLTAINKILPADKALSAADLASVGKVFIAIAPGSDDVIADVVPDSKTNPIVTLDLQFTLLAKHGETLPGGKRALTLAGVTKVKLTDYRRVDQSTMQAASKPVVIKVSAKAPATAATYGDIAKALDGYFDITSPEFTTSLFPIWNIDPATNQPMFIDQASGDPVKHSLNKAQIDTLASMYTGLDGTGHGDFSKARIERAVQKVVFTPADGKTDADKIQHANGAFEGKFNVTITFIQHWSWNKATYTDRAADFTLQGVPVKVSFKK